MRVAWVALLVLLLAGCSSPKPSEATPTVDPSAVAPTLAPEAVPLHFASGDYEAISTYEATFAATDMCLPQCQGNAVQLIDLTPVVPAEAPVELTVAIEHDGSVSSSFVFTDAEPVQISQEGGGNGPGGGGGATQLSALLSRAPSGTVQLRLTHRFIAIDASNPAGSITASIEVSSVVRSKELVSGMPAALNLPAGAVLNFTNDDLEQVVLFAPNGQVLRDVDAPFTLTAPNGTSGPSILLVSGDTTGVLGPNVTMSARRVVLVETAPKDLVAGTTTLDLSAEASPLIVGVSLTPKPVAAFVNVAPFVGPYTVSITAPGSVDVLSEDCRGGFAGSPFCEFGFVLGDGGDTTFTTGFLDENLVPGSYTITIEAQQANSYEASAFALLIA